MNKKVKLILGLTLALGVMLGLAAVASAGSIPPVNSNADIAFEPGTLEPIIPTPGGKDDLETYEFALNFGLREVPYRREVYYGDGYGSDKPVSGGTPASGAASNAPIGVTIKDARANTTGWTYSVSMTPFRDTNGANPAFNATMFLLDGEKTTNRDVSAEALFTLNGGGTYDIQEMPTYTYPEGAGTDVLVVNTDTNSVTVLSATSALGSGLFGAQWDLRNVRLQLGADFNSISNANYVSTMTWTLQAI